MTDKLTTALQKIAHGRTDCGRPLSGSNAQGIARDALFESGLGWSHNVLRPAPAAPGVPLQQRPGYRAEPRHPITRDLRDLSEEHGLSGAVLITFGAGRVGVDSTGRTEEFALVMRKLGERVLLAIDDGDYDPAKLLRGTAN